MDLFCIGLGKGKGRVRSLSSPCRPVGLGGKFAYFFVVVVLDGEHCGTGSKMLRRKNSCFLIHVCINAMYTRTDWKLAIAVKSYRFLVKFTKLFRMTMLRVTSSISGWSRNFA